MWLGGTLVFKKIIFHEKFFSDENWFLLIFCVVWKKEKIIGFPTSHIPNSITPQLKINQKKTMKFSKYNTQWKLKWCRNLLLALCPIHETPGTSNWKWHQFKQKFDKINQRRSKDLQNESEREFFFCGEVVLRSELFF